MRLAPVLLAATLTACVPPGEALHDASLSTAPDAPGFLIIGLAEQNYAWNLANWTQSIALTLTSPGQAPVTAARKGCGSLTGLVGDKPCNLAQMQHLVLQLPPGAWTAAEVTEAYHLADGDHMLQAALPNLPITIRPGQITYAGDFTFASDAVSPSITLVARSHDDAGAQYALNPYPHLRSTTVIFRP